MTTTMTTIRIIDLETEDFLVPCSSTSENTEVLLIIIFYSNQAGT